MMIPSALEKTSADSEVFDPATPSTLCRSVCGLPVGVLNANPNELSYVLSYGKVNDHVKKFFRPSGYLSPQRCGNKAVLMSTAAEMDGFLASDLIKAPVIMNAKKVRIPSEGECYEIIAEMGMLENIIAHSLQVRRVSLFIVDHLINNSLNRELVGAAALLHDITKTRSLSTKEDHAKTGEILLAAKGYPEVGRIVGQHVFICESYSDVEITEAEVVNYADKRVLHDGVASLEERMNYILQRYGSTAERREWLDLLREKSRRLERKIFKSLSFRPEDLGFLLIKTIR
jgi:putative nucleotidyltransferase with HDIG domain